MLLCDYGCKQEANFRLKNGKWCCCKSPNSCPAIKKKNSESILKSEKHKNRDYKNRYKNMSQESKDRMRWDKGLTKDNDIRIYNRSMTYKINYQKGLYGKKSGCCINENEEINRRKKISDARIKYLENNHNVLWKTLSNGVKVQGDWEFNVGEELLRQGYNITRTRLYYDNYRSYTPDFNLGGNIYVEVKGWLSNNNIDKYRLVKKEYPNIIIYLIRDENKIYNYTKFINGLIKLEDCEKLWDVI